MQGFLILSASMIIGAITMIVVNKCRKPKETSLDSIPSFSVSEYLERMENVITEIWEEQENTEQTITLWWGLDGLQLGEDGESVWISRGKRKKSNVFNTEPGIIELDWSVKTLIPPTPQAKRPSGGKYFSESMAVWDAMLNYERSQTNMRMEAAQYITNENIINALQSYIVPIIPSYNSINCCCNSYGKR